MRDCSVQPRATSHVMLRSRSIIPFTTDKGSHMKRSLHRNTGQPPVSLICIAILSITTILTCGRLHAQQTGEWLTVDRPHAGEMNTQTLFVDGATAGHYVVISQESASTGPYVVRRTTDGGARWDVMRSDPGAGWRVTGMAHPTPDLIIVIGDTAVTHGFDDNFNPIRTYYPFILRSTDAGVTWARQDLPDSVVLRSISMGSDGSGGIVGLKILTSTSTAPYLYSTIDGGATWASSAIRQEPGLPTYVAHVSPQRYAAIAYNSLVQGYDLLRTSDRGATWTSVSLPRGVVAITFVDSLLGWGVGGNRTGVGDTERDLIVRTTDGGATWTTVLDSAIDFRFGLRDIDFADRDHGIAVGGYGKILRTSDGGLTWTHDWPNSTLVAEYVGMNDVAYPAPDDAMAITRTAGYVLHYTGRQRMAAPFFLRPSSGLGALPLDVTLEWTPVGGALWYDLQIADTTLEYNTVNPRVFDAPYLSEIGLAGATRAVHLEAATRYAMRVRARGATDTSDWSPQIHAITTSPTSVKRPESRDAASLAVRPLPAHGRALVSLRLARPGPVRLRLLNALGEDLGEFFSGMLGEGEHVLPLDLAGHPTGALYVMLENGEERSTVMLLNAR
jgi:photosystem II stability/assembly factor-like uncharacterized protein